MKNKTTTPKAAKKASKATAHKDRKEENSLQDIICRHRAKARALHEDFFNKPDERKQERTKEQEQYERDVCAWYSQYFTQGIIKGGRAAVGMIINPAKNNTWIAIEKLLDELSLQIHIEECKAGTYINEETEQEEIYYEKISSCLNDAKSIAHCFAVISSLLETIADTWSDTAAIALSTKFHWDYLTRETKGGLISDRWYLDDEEKRRITEGYECHYDDFLADLNRLSCLLLQPPQENIIETMVHAEIRKHEHESDGKKTRQNQRERAAKWLKDENAKGHEVSIMNAALHFNKELDSEKVNGGYEDAASLCTAMNRQSEKLGISKFKDPTRGRPRKQKKR